MKSRSVLKRLKQALVALPVALTLTTATTTASAADTWACEIVLCLANPQGPTAVEQCVPPIKRMWKALAKGKSIPTCKFSDKDGKETESRASGSYIETAGADPYAAGACPFVYYAGESQQKFCAFTGVTNQYINGALWGRIWYGGPEGKPYIEMLHVDPDHPRAADGFEAAWALQKASIESKSDYAALAMTIAIASEARAAAAERVAARARTEANAAAARLASLEATLPEALERANRAWSDASVAWDAVAGPYLAARARAEAFGATAADRAAYEALRPAAEGAFNVMQRASEVARYYATEIASLPAKRVEVERVVGIAVAAEAEAWGLRATADRDQAERVAANEAAKPLPDYASY